MTLQTGNTLQHLRDAARWVFGAAAIACLSTAAHATDYSEGPVLYKSVNGVTVPYEAADLSSSGSSPTNIGALTLGSNVVSGETVPYGPIANAATGERQFQDNDYFTFTVPTGDVLSKLFLVGPTAADPNGTTIVGTDLFFIGIASGSSVNVTPPSSAGLLGYTLAPASAIGTDILPALGLSSPPGFSGPPFTGATTFSGALPAGTYSVWLLDGDNPVTYKLNLLVSAVPEPASWVMMMIGVGAIGATLRRRPRWTARFAA